jgi:hypothetical protein
MSTPSGRAKPVQNHTICIARHPDGRRGRAHNPEVVGSNPTPATTRVLVRGYVVASSTSLLLIVSSSGTDGSLESFETVEDEVEAELELFRVVVAPLAELHHYLG